MTDISKNQLVLAGFHADNVYIMFDIDDEFHALLLSPVETPETWLKYINSPKQKDKKLPLENPKSLKIVDIKDLEKTIENLKKYEYSIESSCMYCNKKTTVAYGFKILRTYYIWNDLVLHMATDHNIYTSISIKFAQGMFNKLNPWFGSKYTIDCFKPYNKSEAPVNASLINNHSNYFTDGFIKIEPTRHDIQKYDNYEYNCISAICPIYPIPQCIPYYIDTLIYMEYIVINQAPATPENPQIVAYCQHCIGTTMNKFGIDRDVTNPTHVACLWNGTRFIGPNGETSSRLCGQID